MDLASFPLILYNLHLQYGIESYRRGKERSESLIVVMTFGTVNKSHLFQYYQYLLCGITSMFPT